MRNSFADRETTIMRVAAEEAISKHGSGPVKGIEAPSAESE
jgi:hypothetical protein